ncbi:inositol 1,4,5-trisphosphate receptor-interacting protein-like isoform X1 [Oncorhynchus keta]|uniref:inositol 1,4,5-trisphosphate receptor-interacting protein-like isoform X1 n=2 Tax=Oncorhynchus keta TaxID=8018 RepID=UPI0015FB30F4|nr:inositol 1,4,5-trisphosphate receptor-interacting protein-like isoform X1 [Oncorhynchus keta]XP_035610251.1 inositol 1,4,5-trisphosphate receptor-interacting protein-like isoform X1 [Oncorhynchus keta]XP_052354564.1 inositol 1,4,5-trisphosphate receptor-interacting protein-like isoform X1 [Oncorhynchus keta]
MQGAIARVFVVVAAAILNHPLLFPQENTTLPEQDEALLARMREHEKRLELEQARLEQELLYAGTEQQDPGSEDGYGWYFWSALSLVIFFTIEVCRQDLADMEARYADDEDGFVEGGSINSKTLQLDKGVLNSFCERCIHTSAHENWRVREFVEGFTDDLLESLRSVCDRETDMEVADFVGVGSMFESWRVSKPLMCDLIVPFAPPEPYSFQFHLWCSPSSDVPLDMQGCGRIKVTKVGENEDGCLCGSANLGEDMLCLLHSKNKKPRADYTLDDLLCSKNTPYLAKDQVMKWFQISVTKAWGRISHKYEFELTFRNLDATGALKVRFRSGKVVVMNIIPVVELDGTNAYFVSHFPSDSSTSSDTYWPLSFAVYERNLLKHLAKSLPENSCHLHCLQIITFLHNKQMGLTGRCALTNYHLKTTLLHLLLSKGSSSWGSESLEYRLRDMLGFLHRSLQEKRLCHALVGNSQVPPEVQVPETFHRAEPINLFRPLVLQRELYADTLRHFQEMLRNAPVLIQEYTPLLQNGDTHHRFNSMAQSD